MTDPKFGSFEISKPVILYHNDLFIPRAFMKNGVPQGAPKYQAQFIIRNDHPQLAELIDLAHQVAKVGKLTKSQALAWSFGSGDTVIAKAKAEGKDTKSWEATLAGTTILKTSGPSQPRLYAPLAGVITLTTDQKLFYRGARAAVVGLMFKAYDGMGGGVHAYTNDLVVVPGGQRIGGREVPETWAGKVAAAMEDADEETAGF